MAPLAPTGVICKAEGIAASNCWVICIARGSCAARVPGEELDRKGSLPVTETVDCRAASQLLSVAYERRLMAAERVALQGHLDKCFMCRNFDSQLRFLHNASQRYRTKD
jgi:hypothetical protein